jgi:hypothetical protein
MLCYVEYGPMNPNATVQTIALLMRRDVRGLSVEPILHEDDKCIIVIRKWDLV